VLFNAEQIDGLEPLARRVARALDAGDAVQKLVQSSGANIVVTENQIRFEPESDTLFLTSSLSDSERAARALRALAHWTGHTTRHAHLGRAPVGSSSAAAEELRAAIYAMGCAHELGLELPRGPRLELRDEWIRLLKRDPLEIGRAAAGAERVREFLREPNRNEQRHAAKATSLAVPAKDHPFMPDKPKQYLAVPYADYHRAWALGARWDREAKCVYIGPAANHDALARWLPGERNMPRSSNAREEFAAVLRSLGLEVSGAHPIMDGRRHRLRAEGDRGRETAGYYIGRLEGIANGFAGNYRTGQQMPWSARGHARSAEELAELRAQTAQAAAARAEERRRIEQGVATKLHGRLSQLHALTQDAPYLGRKQIAATAGALVVNNADGCTPQWWPFAAWPCRDGTICLPARDARGRLWTMQYIDPDGGKRYEPNSFKRGCFHVIGARELDTANAFIVAEGYATATTIHELVRAPGVVVVAGFDSGNLPEVAAGLRGRFPRTPIVVAGDNDERLLHRPPHKNVGLEKANAAAAAANGVAIVPAFPRGSDPALTDFNDLATLGASHRTAIARQLNGALERARLQVRANVDVLQRAQTRARA
jgi:putative DNA primase/helicase